MSKICVPGSLNVDLTLTLERFHQPGETITAKDIHTYAGGKGGNQAVAAAKLGCEVLMVGMLGEDDNGKFYRRRLVELGVDVSGVGTAPGTPSGTAIIEVDAKGENRIAIVPGTNALVDKAYVERMLDAMLKCDIFMMQYEISLDTVCYLAQVLHQHGKTVILDPAPAQQAPQELYANVDYLTPNSTELALLTGMPVSTPEETVAAARKLLDQGVGAVVAKRGREGCMYIDRQSVLTAPGFQVKTVDTTAAGDSFNAGLAVALAQGKPIEEALVFANAVGCLSTMGAGAQGAMPTLAQVEEFLAARA